MREGSSENRIVTSPGLPSWDCIDAVSAYGGMTGEFLPSEYTIRSFLRDVLDVPVFKIATLRFYMIGMTGATQKHHCITLYAVTPLYTPHVLGGVPMFLSTLAWEWAQVSLGCNGAEK